jgi:hypothetical protein
MPILHPSKYSWYSFLLRGWIDPRAIVRPEGFYQWEIPIKQSEIEPAIFPACGVMTQPTTPPRAHSFSGEVGR